MKFLKKIITKSPKLLEILVRLHCIYKFVNLPVVFRVLFYGSYEAKPLHYDLIPRLCHNFLNKGDYVLCDIGANHGVFSKNVLRYSANIKIIAFEPQKSCQIYLDDITKKYKNFEVRFIGIGDVKKELEFNQYSNDGLSSFKEIQDGAYQSHTEGTNTEEKYPVRISTLDKELEFIENKNIFLKIDVQGLEKEVLDGAKKLFSEERIAGIYIELMCKSKYQNDTYEYFINYLSSEGFIISDLATGYRDEHNGFIDEFDVLFLHKKFFK